MAKADPVMSTRYEKLVLHYLSMIKLAHIDSVHQTHSSVRHGLAPAPIAAV